MYVVYTEMFENGEVSRWYYGTYNDKNRANEVANELGNEFPVFHCVCKLEEAEAYGIENMPM